MPSNKLLVVAAMLAATIVAAAGCGGSSKTTTTAAVVKATPTTTTQTKPAVSEEIKVSTGKPLATTAWIAKGDAICRSANAKLSTTTAKTQQDFARLLPQAAGYERAEATELSKLVPPPGKAGDWQQMLTDMIKFSALSLKAGEYAQVNNFPAAIPIATAGNKAQLELITIAKDDGFKVCSLP